MTRGRVLCGSYAGDEELEPTATKINDPIAERDRFYLNIPPLNAGIFLTLIHVPHYFASVIDSSASSGAKLSGSIPDYPAT